MESLQKVIKQTEQQLEQAIKKSRTADIKECVSLDQEINRLQASLKSLRESERLQELLETDETPTDLLTQAKLRNLEMAGQLCEEQIDSEGNDPRMIAFNRFSCAIAILDLLKQASKFPDIGTLPTKELYGNLASFVTAKQEKVEKSQGKAYRTGQRNKHHRDRSEGRYDGRESGKDHRIFRITGKSPQGKGIFRTYGS